MGRYSPSAERLACSQRPRGFLRRRCRGSLSQDPGFSPLSAECGHSRPCRRSLRTPPSPEPRRSAADRMGRPPLVEALGDRPRPTRRSAGQLASPGPTPPRPIRRLLRVARPHTAAGHRHGPPHGEPSSGADPTEPRHLPSPKSHLGHRLDPSALVETQTPCHTENLHRSVADSYNRPSWPICRDHRWSSPIYDDLYRNHR